MKVVGSPRRISNPKPLLWLCKMGGYYLCKESSARLNNHAKYFREGSRRLYVTSPTWFKDPDVARAAARAKGFRVRVRKEPWTANAKPNAPKRRAGGKA